MIIAIYLNLSTETTDQQQQEIPTTSTSKGGEGTVIEIIRDGCVAQRGLLIPSQEQHFYHRQRERSR